MYNIGIIGLGIVGNSIENFFKNKNEYNLFCYDKYKKINNINIILNTNYLFLCLPTPFDEEINEYNKKEVHNVCEFLSKNNYKGIIFFKSTVEPNTTNNLYLKYKLNIYHNPEFLSQKTANIDFINQNHIVIGYNENKNLDTVNNFYKNLFPNANISLVKSEESELMKLTCNNFYAVKIQFFNKIYDLCNKINCDYNVVKNLVLKNNWINRMHTDVPGSDGKLSYGGACFPKDTNALNNFMKKNNSLNAIIDSSIEERNSIRGKDNI